MAFIVILWEQFLPDFHDVRVVLTKNSYLLPVCMSFYNNVNVLLYGSDNQGTLAPR